MSFMGAISVERDKKYREREREEKTHVNPGQKVFTHMTQGE